MIWESVRILKEWLLGMLGESSDTRTEAENVPHQNQTSGDFDIILYSSIALL